MEGASFLLAVLIALVLLVGVVLGLFVLAVLIRLGAVKIYAQNYLQAPAE